MTTSFGKLLRKIRIDLELTLKDMAAQLEVSAAYLSSVEVGKKPLTSNFTNDIIRWVVSHYEDDVQREDIERELTKAASQSVNEVKVRNSQPDSMELALSFARKFEDGSINLEKLKALLAEEQ